MMPIMFHLGSYPVHSYGVMLAVAVLVGFWVGERAARRWNMETDQVLSLTLAVVVSGVLGSRLAYVILKWPQYAGDLPAVLRIWDGGLSYYGAVIAGILVVLYYRWRTGLPGGTIADVAALGGAAGYPWARIGCFLNGCCYGKPTNLPWAVTFPSESVPRHPTQLYAVVIGAVILLVLWRIARNRRYPGQIALLYLLFYGVYRFGIEFVRVSPPAGAHLTIGQVVSLVVGGGAGVVLVVKERWGRSRE